MRTLIKLAIYGAVAGIFWRVVGQRAKPRGAPPLQEPLDLDVERIGLTDDVSGGAVAGFEGDDEWLRTLEVSVIETSVLIDEPFEITDDVDGPGTFDRMGGEG